LLGAPASPEDGGGVGGGVVGNSGVGPGSSRLGAGGSFAGCGGMGLDAASGAAPPASGVPEAELKPTSWNRFGASFDQHADEHSADKHSADTRHAPRAVRNSCATRGHQTTARIDLMA